MELINSVYFKKAALTLFVREIEFITVNTTWLRRTLHSNIYCTVN